MVVLVWYGYVPTEERLLKRGVDVTDSRVAYKICRTSPFCFSDWLSIVAKTGVVKIASWLCVCTPPRPLSEPFQVGSVE